MGIVFMVSLKEAILISILHELNSNNYLDVCIMYFIPSHFAVTIFSIMFQDVVAACEIVNCNGVEVQCQVWHVSDCGGMGQLFVWYYILIVVWNRNMKRNQLLNYSQGSQPWFLFNKCAHGIFNGLDWNICYSKRMFLASVTLKCWPTGYSSAFYSRILCYSYADEGDLS